MPVHEEPHVCGGDAFLEELEKWSFRSFLNKKANRVSSGLLHRSAEASKLQESLTEPGTLSAFSHFNRLNKPFCRAVENFFEGMSLISSEYYVFLKEMLNLDGS